MSTKVAIAGSGFFSQFHVDAWARLDVDVVGICSLDAETARRHADRLGGPPVFDDAARMLAETKPDILDIVTPPATHLTLIEAALAAEVAVICQKPFCGGLEGAEAAVRRQAESGVPLIVHENFRFQPWYREIARRLAAGAVGDVYGASFRLRPGDGQGADAYLARQPYFQKMPRFLVHETLVHLIDVMRFLLGEVSSVYADLRRLNPVIKGEDAGVVILDFVGGRQAVIDGNRLVDHPARNRRLVMGDMLVEGSQGVIALDGDGGLSLRRLGDNAAERIDYDWRDSGFGGDCVYAFTAHALAAIRDGGGAETDAAKYLANLRLVEAVYRSAAEGRRIST